MDEPTEPNEPGWRRWLLAGLVVVLVAVAFGVRAERGDMVVVENDILFRDNDTARRLVRLENLVDPDKPYPYQNPDDGYPEGSVIHWTLPMDWVILALDPLVSWAYPEAERFEAGAIWADSVLGALSVLAFALLSMRWLGPWVGLLATALYGFSFPAVHITLYGLGDHQALQHLFSVVALLGFACLLGGKGGRGLGWLVGASLGMAMWVSTESSIVLYTMTLGALGHLLLLGDQVAEERGSRALRMHLRWTAACLVVAFVGDRFEHPGALLTFEWDKVSGFWLYQILVFALFLVACRKLAVRLAGWRGPAVAAGASVVLGLVVLFATGLGGPLGEQMELFRNANRWTQSTVVEYRALFVAFGAFYPLLATYQLGWLILGIPLWLWGCAVNRSSPTAVRVPVLGMAAVLFAFTCLEMKVSHLFVILYPWVLITGGGWFLDRFAGWAKIGEAAKKTLAGALGLAVVVSLFFGLPPKQIAPTQEQLDVRELTDALRRLREENGEDEMRSVLAHWNWGAQLMYYAGVPVVATGYHRNLAGIEDSYRVLAGTSLEVIEPILKARRVRWIVSAAGHSIFGEVHDVMPTMPRYMEITGSSMDPGDGVRYEYALLPIIRDTLHYFLTTWHPALAGEPHFELVFESSNRTRQLDDEKTAYMQPVFRIWRVVYPEERP